MNMHTETMDERWDRKLREMQEAKEKALERITGLCRRTDLRSHPWGKGLVFEPSGAARMANIAGFLRGLEMAGASMGVMEQLVAAGSGTLSSPQELALHLAESLNNKLTYLGDYGGTREFEVEEATEDREATVIKVPAHKVLLYDDGTFGGFGILWHRPYTTDQVQAKARKHDEEAYQGKTAAGEELDAEESRTRWDAALKKAEEGLRIRKGLEEYRTWTPHWAAKAKADALAAHVAHAGDEWVHSCKEPACKRALDNLRYSNRAEFIRYGFSFNGGLLLRGMGSPTFAVRLDNDSGPSWSVHT
jgi:hypothetical protein